MPDWTTGHWSKKDLPRPMGNGASRSVTENYPDAGGVSGSANDYTSNLNGSQTAGGQSQPQYAPTPLPNTGYEIPNTGYKKLGDRQALAGTKNELGDWYDTARNAIGSAGRAAGRAATNFATAPARFGAFAGKATDAVGNLLDLPGSMVRDVFSGHNPVDQLRTPLSSDNRSTSRDVVNNMVPMWSPTNSLNGIYRGSRADRAAALREEEADLAARPDGFGDVIAPKAGGSKGRPNWMTDEQAWEAGYEDNLPFDGSGASANTFEYDPNKHQLMPERDLPQQEEETLQDDTGDSPWTTGYWGGEGSKPPGPGWERGGDPEKGEPYWKPVEEEESPWSTGHWGGKPPGPGWERGGNPEEGVPYWISDDNEGGTPPPQNEWPEAPPGTPDNPIFPPEDDSSPDPPKRSDWIPEDMDDFRGRWEHPFIRGRDYDSDLSDEDAVRNSLERQRDRNTDPGFYGINSPPTEPREAYAEYVRRQSHPMNIGKPLSYEDWLRQQRYQSTRGNTMEYRPGDNPDFWRNSSEGGPPQIGKMSYL